MRYEINVSKDGKHYFATDERSLRGTREQAQAMARHFQQVFPVADGYKVDLTEHHEYGKTVEINVDYDSFGRPIKCSCCGTTKDVHRDGGSGGPYRCGSPDCLVF